MSSIKIIDSSRRFGKRRHRRYTRLAAVMCLLFALGFLLQYVLAAGAEVESRTVRQAANDARSRQSEIFADWYEEHQEHLRQLDRVWQSYILIQRQFAAEEIGVETTAEQLRSLNGQAAEAEKEIREAKPPLSLDGDAYDLTAIVYHRTADYARELRLMVRETGRAAENYCKAEDDVPQEVMSRNLREISVRLAPTALFTEKEISRLRNLFMSENGH